MPSADNFASQTKTPCCPPVGQGDYVVRSGDCLNSISEAHGFFWKTLWELPENEEVKRVRRDPDVLLPGDRLTIPELRLKEIEKPTEQTHRFRRKGVPTRLVLEFRDGDNPRANWKYLLIIDGASRRGQTDEGGRLKEAIPNGARSARVIFEGHGAREEYVYDLGGLDPHDSVTGVQARLRNLGYSIPHLDGQLEEDTRAALGQFQADHGLEVTRDMDDETCDKLRDAHGC